MKVKELVEKLQKLDQELPLHIQSIAGGNFDVIAVAEEKLDYVASDSDDVAKAKLIIQ